MARILYLHQYFRTPDEGGAIRSYYLSQALRAAGHQVIIVTSHNHPKEEIKHIDGVEVHYLPVFYENNLSRSGRIISFLKFMRHSLLKASQLHKQKRFDLCYATSTPLTIGIPARWMKFRFGVPYIFEVRDLWPEAAIQMGVIKSRFWKWFLRKMEYWIYTKARCIIALSPGMKAGVEKVVPTKKVHLVPNMSDTDFFNYREKAGTGPLQVLYIGSIGKSNHLEYLLDVAQRAQEQQMNVRFVIAGNGSEKARLRHLAEERKLGCVEFRLLEHKDGVRKLLAECDLVYISFLQLPILQTNSPNKFFDAIAAGKPCVINIPGWIADEIKLHNIGLYYPPDAPDILIDFLRTLQSKPGMIDEMGVNARKLAEEKYSRRALSACVVEIVGELLASSH